MIRFIALIPRESTEDAVAIAVDAVLAHGRSARYLVADEPPQDHVEVKPGAFDGWTLWEPIEAAELRAAETAAAEAEREAREAQASRDRALAAKVAAEARRDQALAVKAAALAEAAAHEAAATAAEESP